MTTTLGQVMPNTIPTATQVSRETLYLDAHGITVSGLLDDHPVTLDKSIGKQAIIEPLIDLMADDGWAFAGAGHFAAVFVKGGLALKMGFKVTDTGAMYAAWCRRNPQPGVPEVYAITKYSGCYLVLMRRYDPLPKQWKEVPELKREFTLLQGTINRGDKEGVGRFDTVKAALSIRDFFEGVASFDLHEDNVMMDGAGELVITDPISFGPCSGAAEGSYYYSPQYA